MKEGNTYDELFWEEHENYASHDRNENVKTNIFSRKIDVKLEKIMKKILEIKDNFDFTPFYYLPVWRYIVKPGR